MNKCRKYSHKICIMKQSPFWPTVGTSKSRPRFLATCEPSREFPHSARLSRGSGSRESSPVLHPALYRRGGAAFSSGHVPSAPHEWSAVWGPEPQRAQGSQGRGRDTQQPLSTSKLRVTLRHALPTRPQRRNHLSLGNSLAICLCPQRNNFTSEPGKKARGRCAQLLFLSLFPTEYGPPPPPPVRCLPL